jgi:hypothetical protein
VSEKPLEMRHFQALTYPEEPELAPFWAAGIARDGQNETKRLQLWRLDV